MAQKERHKLAYTKVEVFRLFKVRDLAVAVEKSTEPVVADLGRQMRNACMDMLHPYVEQQKRIIERDKAKKFPLKKLDLRINLDVTNHSGKARKLKVKWPKSRKTAAHQRDRR